MRFAVLLLAMISTGAAAESCPWLNAATAGGALGGAVTSVTVKRANAGDDANCDFIRHEGSLTLELRIETGRDYASYAARCHSDKVPLRGIGNEAVACSSDDEVGEQVVGRVRERAFLVRIRSNARSAARSDVRDEVRKVAELVAGFLF
ncbi:MAG: hypothetical protein ABSH56_23575 [Bryobacteraceae bacterium]|jgi:hypothetical protein